MKSIIFILMLAMIPVKAHAFGWFLLGYVAGNSGGDSNNGDSNKDDRGIFIEVYNNKCENKPFMVKVSKITKITPLTRIKIERGGFFSDDKYKQVNFTAIYTPDTYYPYCIKESYDEAKKSLLKMSGKK